MKTFMGEYNNKVDAKGRIIVPSKFREKLGDTFVVTKGFDNCLYVYDMDNWEGIQTKLEQMLSFLLPLYQEEGKTMLVVAVGCTGGRHRSVSIARAVAEYLNKLGYPAYENHRDITRG